MRARSWRSTGLGWVIAAAVALSVGFASDTAFAGKADEVFLKNLAGEWKGRGKLRPSVSAKLEPVSCRMTAKWDGGGKSLSISMTCRGVDVKFSSSGFLQTLKSNNVVEGRWTGSNGIGKTSVFGKRSGNALSLTLTSRDAKSGDTVTSSVSMRLSGGGRALKNTVTLRDRDTGKKFQVLSLSLKK